MSTVFIAGSRSIKRLPKEVLRRLEKIISSGLSVVVGDCYGVDTIIQEFFFRIGYRNVTVFHLKGRCRTNIGKWPTVAVAGRGQVAKDRAMAEKSDHGLMVWDGHSIGTARNIAYLNVQRKPCVVCRVSVAVDIPVEQ